MSSIISKWIAAAASPGTSAYDPSLGWNSSAQPIEGLEGKEYLELSHIALPVLREKMIAQCERSHLSFVEIPHEDYRQGFEKGTQAFRPWFNEYCHTHGLNPNVNVAIVGPCVKDVGSSEFKQKTRQPDRVRDYLRGMEIFLDGPTRKTATQSLENMGEAINALENDDFLGSVSRKNYLHSPKSNGYRAYKAGWVVDLPEQYKGWSMLAEVKVEHESQQDVNRMTRRFMGISRHARDSIENFYPNCTSSRDNDFRTTASNLKRVVGRVEDLDNFSRRAYDALHEKSGLNRFLDKGKADQFKAVSNEEFYFYAKKAVEAFGPAVLKEIENAGFQFPKLRGMAYKNDLALQK